MNSQDLEIARDEQIEILKQIIAIYRGVERKSKRILEIIVIVCAIALYFTFFDLFGGIWGFILTVGIIFVGVLCVENLGITFKNSTISDEKLAYQACVAMDILLQIKKGTYRTDVANILCCGQGKHTALYKEFSQLYPNLATKELEKLAKIKVDQKDMFN